MPPKNLNASIATNSNTKEAILQRVNALDWVHSIDLGQGIKTKGRWGDHTPGIWKAFDQTDFKNKKVLDIGCWDGLFSFEAEKRGATDVYATDEVSQRSQQDQPCFTVAHEILNSKAKYLTDISVYELRERFDPVSFDIAIFCGIYYHLRHPLLGLAQLRAVIKEGGTLILEGPVLNNYEESFTRFFYPEVFGDPSTWWLPTISCLRGWVESSYFEIVAEFNSLPPAKPSLLRSAKQAVKRAINRKEADVVSRYTLVARAVERDDSKHVFPDADLRAFDPKKYQP